MRDPLTIVWFRNDLRLADQPALAAAARRGAVVPVFVWAPQEEGDWTPGAASRWWLHHALQALRSDLRRHHLDLVVRTGPTLDALRAVAAEAGADAVYWNRRYEPAILARDRNVKAALAADGLAVESFNGALLHEPWQVETKAGEPYKVFTPFWKTCLASQHVAAPVATPVLSAGPTQVRSMEIDELELLPGIDWAAGMRGAWQPGARGAEASLQVFLEEGLEHYADGRDRPDRAWTSRLSPHLHWGEIGIRDVWDTLDRSFVRAGAAKRKGIEKFRAELGWREFAHHLLFHFPDTTDEPLRKPYAAFPWRDDDDALRAWQRGGTGYPLVDAGMRQLWATGWMHNRVRMVVGSFLVKHLVLRWQDGARWFWDTLVDADLASNTLGWQWTAGCGADAAPYFRIFNPITQGERFDPDGAYVRRWVPELERLSAAYIHQPWTAPASARHDAGVTLGDNYPEPIVEHGFARRRALDALATVTKD